MAVADRLAGDEGGRNGLPAANRPRIGTLLCDPVALAACRGAGPEADGVAPGGRPVVVSNSRAGFRRFLSFVGPGYLVAVGYMDPGNWAAAVSAGSAYGSRLLSVVLISSLMAMCLQAAAARLGLAADLDLARACRLHFGRRTNFLMWIGCEIAIVACNVAEVLGMALGLQLVLGIPLTWGVCLTALDVILILQLQRRHFGALQTIIIALTALVGACLALQLWWLAPSADLLWGFVPSAELLRRPDMLYVAIAILGATVMPHNLYLHSSVVRPATSEARKIPVAAAIRYATADSNLALSLALLVNVAILVLAAGAFHRAGMQPVNDLSDAYRLLSPVLGVGAAGTVFGLALIASGFSSSITGTLAGQVVMDGFLDIPVSRVTRAFLGRALAIAPAVGAAVWAGSGGVTRLLVLTQVILGLQLPFAVVPLLWFTTRRHYLGRYAFGRLFGAVLWLIAAVVIAGNSWLLWSILR